MSLWVQVYNGIPRGVKRSTTGSTSQESLLSYIPLA
nr:MAG TPA: hypothetical protein [Caudoviricetes sp.]